MFDDLPRPLVLATGVFDLLHVEHIRLLNHASCQGASLVVGINSDESVRRLKGQHRPIIGQEDRSMMLRALKTVNRVVIFEQDTPVELVRHIRPDVFVKGHDYKGVTLPEESVVRGYGGEVWIANTSNRTSTSQIIERIRSMP